MNMKNDNCSRYCISSNLGESSNLAFQELEQRVSQMFPKWNTLRAHVMPRQSFGRLCMKKGLRAERTGNNDRSTHVLSPFGLTLAIVSIRLRRPPNSLTLLALLPIRPQSDRLL